MHLVAVSAVRGMARARVDRGILASFLWADSLFPTLNRKEGVQRCPPCINACRRRLFRGRRGVRKPVRWTPLKVSISMAGQLLDTPPDRSPLS